MHRLFLPNLLFEEELSGGGLKLAARSRVDDLAHVMGLLTDHPGDLILVDPNARPGDVPDCLSHVRFVTASECDQQDLSQTVLVPWGCSPQSRRHALHWKLRYDPPAAPVVLEVNSRRFLWPRDLIVALDRDPHLVPLMASGPHESIPGAGVPADPEFSWHQMIDNQKPFSVLCQDPASVQQQLKQWAAAGCDRWVIKAEISQAARNRICGRGDRLSEIQQNWIQNQCRSGRVVALEPWVRTIAECGIQLSVGQGTTHSPGGIESIHVHGVAELINTASGQYLGSLFAADPVGDQSLRVWEPAIAHSVQVARDAARLGYGGPLGIDCMIFVDCQGERFLRMCHDINGRLTMGRVAINMRTHLRACEYGLWAHFSSDLLDAGRESLSFALPDGVRMVRTSPIRTGNRRSRIATALFCSSRVNDLRLVVRNIEERRNLRQGVE